MNRRSEQIRNRRPPLQAAEDAAAESSPNDPGTTLKVVAEPSAPQPPEAPQSPTLKYDLKYKFTPGEVVRTEVVHRATVQTTIEGTTQIAETQSKSTKIWQINAVADDGTVSFVNMVEKIDMWQKTQGRKEVRYNSEAGDEVPPGYEDVAKAVGVPLTTLTMDNRGKVLKRQEKLPQPMSLSTQVTMPLPNRPIVVGESWSSPMEIDVILKDGSTKKVQTRQKFTLEKVASDVATITIDTQILTPVHDPAIEAQLIQRLSAGTARFDIATGRMLSQQLDLDRRVIGFSGPTSSMHYLTRFTEQLLPAPDQTARRDAAPSRATKKSAALPNAKPEPKR